MDDLESKSLQLALVTDYNTINIVPSLKFDRSGYIRKFVFSGRFLDLTGSDSRQLYPEIQVWRLKSNTSDSHTVDTYTKVASIGNETAPSFTGRINVYEFKVETELYVEESDVLGYYQPPSSVSVMGLVAVNDGMRESYFLYGQNPDEFTLSDGAVGKYTRIPLINFEYGELSPAFSLPLYVSHSLTNSVYLCFGVGLCFTLIHLSILDLTMFYTLQLKCYLLEREAVIHPPKRTTTHHQQS